MVLRKFIAGAGLCLLLNYGCIQEQKELNPVNASLTSKLTNSDDEQLAKRVQGLSEKIFPKGGVINFGKSESGLLRYLSIDVIQEKEKKSLYLQLYIGLDAENREIIDNKISSGDYISARSLLDNSAMDMSLICDSGINGIDPADKNDYSGIREGNGNITLLRNADLFESLKEVDSLYNLILKSSLKILEEKAG